MPTLEALGINRLSVAERLMLVQAILDSVVAEQPPAELSVAKQQELKRRDAELDANPGIALTWGQIRSRIEGSR
jgi:putative addiction module component (TIGR02574 family)